MLSTATDELNLNCLPLKACPCHKFRDKSMPLVSVKRLCQADLDDLFSEQHVYVTDPNRTAILAGTLDPATALYMLSLHDSDALPAGGDTQTTS